MKNMFATTGGVISAGVAEEHELTVVPLSRDEYPGKHPYRVDL